MDLLHARMKYYSMTIDNARAAIEKKPQIHSDAMIIEALTRLQQCAKEELFALEKQLEYIKRETVESLQRQVDQMRHEVALFNDLESFKMQQYY